MICARSFCASIQIKIKMIICHVLLFGLKTIKVDLYYRSFFFLEIFPCESEELNNCSVNATCTHIRPGRFSCSCRDGFIGNGTYCESG